MNEASRIFTNESCTGCNRCITACTVPEANYVRMENGRSKIYIDGEKCINCGKCMVVCPHDARDYTDDTEEFLDRLGGGGISVIVAPAVRTNFPQYEKLLGLLRKLGAKAIYDTSYGADICSWAYIRYIQQHSAIGLISQPCPAVVNFIEKHDTALLPSLAPIHSPVLCTAIYMRKYRGLGGEFAFLSPCIAKKDEFEDSNTAAGGIGYNVTFRKLAEALQRRGHDYHTAPTGAYDNEQHGLGAVYPMPGGLKTNVHSAMPDAWVYQVEGQPEVRNFLNDYVHGRRSREDTPFLVDVLNCAKGCNQGTGALCGEEADLRVSRVMYDAQRELSGSQKTGLFRGEDAQGKLMAKFDKELTLDDFVRHYTNREIKKIQVTSVDIESAFLKMNKQDAADREVNCCSCGYASCNEMAEAIARGLNHPENCVEYHKSVLSQNQSEIELMLDQRLRSGQTLRDSVQQIIESMSETATKSDETTERADLIREEVSALRDIAQQLGLMVDALQGKIEQYVGIGAHIVNLSTQTKLLSMNASVEAAHAREYGKGFAVVAEQMKTLSEHSENSAKEILGSNEMVLPMLEQVRLFSQSLNERTENIARSTGEILQAMRDISQSEQQITDTATHLLQTSDVEQMV